MKSKRTYTCDYCNKSFVSSAFFKASHKKTVNHILNRGKYYESLINQHKLRMHKALHKRGRRRELKPWRRRDEAKEI
jgi:hypothetical protein